VRGAFDLDVATGPEIDILTFRKLKNEFLDESGHVMVASNLARPLLCVEGFRRHFHRHVVLDGDLAAQPLTLSCLFLVDVVLLRGENFSPAIAYLDLALGTGTAASAGTADEHARVCQGTEQLAAGWYFDCFLLVDDDFHRA